MARKNRLIIKHTSDLKTKAHGVSSEECKVWKIYVMSLVMQTYQNSLGLNLYVVSLMSYMVTISEDGLVRSYKKRSKAHCH